VIITLAGMGSITLVHHHNKKLPICGLNRIPNEKKKRVKCGKIKLLTLILILLLLTSGCGSISIGGINQSTLDDLASREASHIYYIKWKIKKRKWSYDYWDYDYEERCGYRYDGWLNQLDYKDPNICTYVCETRPRTEHRNDLFDTFEDCLYFDYKETQ
jgi:hypothetical protein